MRTIQELIDYCNRQINLSEKLHESLSRNVEDKGGYDDNLRDLENRFFINDNTFYKDVVSALTGRMNEVIIDGKRYYSENPIKKTIHKDGEVTIGNFWEVKEDDK